VSVWRLFSVSRYGSRCHWLKDDKFIKVLEGDSVDTDILDEELRLLQDQEPKTCVHFHFYTSRHRIYGRDTIAILWV